MTQANIDLSARQAQESATADIDNAQALATYKAGTATQGAAQVEAQINPLALQAQAAATADILRAHALATFNAAKSTQGAALTQDSLNSSALQADAAGTAAVLQAVALATFNSASSTQSSAQTQVALVQTQAQLDQLLAAQSATQSAAATGTQQWIGALVGGTATTLASAGSLQTQSAAAVAQGAADQRQALNQGPILFLWKWGLPIFVLAAALLSLWGFGRWLKMHTTRQRTAGQTVPVGPVQGVAVIDTPPSAAPAGGLLVAVKGVILPRDPALEAVNGLTPGVSGVETETPPARPKSLINQE